MDRGISSVFFIYSLFSNIFLLFFLLVLSSLRHHASFSLVTCWTVRRCWVLSSTFLLFFLCRLVLVLAFQTLSSAHNRLLSFYGISLSLFFIYLFRSVLVFSLSLFLFLFCRFLPVFLFQFIPFSVYSLDCLFLCFSYIFRSIYFSFFSFLS